MCIHSLMFVCPKKMSNYAMTSNTMSTVQLCDVIALFNIFLEQQNTRTWQDLGFQLERACCSQDRGHSCYWESSVCGEPACCKHVLAVLQVCYSTFYWIFCATSYTNWSLLVQWIMMFATFWFFQLLDGNVLVVCSVKIVVCSIKNWKETTIFTQFWINIGLSWITYLSKWIWLNQRHYCRRTGRLLSRSLPLSWATRSGNICKIVKLAHLTWDEKSPFLFQRRSKRYLRIPNTQIYKRRKTRTISSSTMKISLTFLTNHSHTLMTSWSRGHMTFTNVWTIVEVVDSSVTNLFQLKSFRISSEVQVNAWHCIQICLFSYFCFFSLFCTRHVCPTHAYVWE